jgi:protein phosphatase
VEAVRQTLLDRDGNLQEVSNLAQLLVDAFTLSYISIGAHVTANPECDGMGTTLIVAAVHGGCVAVAHAGDVRGYRHGRDGLARLTLDHSVVARMVREGHLSEAEASWHPLRNRIYSVVSGDEPCRPDVSWYDISAGECLLLCSDGLWSELSDQAIVEVIERGGTAKEIVTVLVDRANEAGGRDNITAVLYRHY